MPLCIALKTWNVKKKQSKKKCDSTNKIKQKKIQTKKNFWNSFSFFFNLLIFSFLIHKLDRSQTAHVSYWIMAIYANLVSSCVFNITCFILITNFSWSRNLFFNHSCYTLQRKTLITLMMWWPFVHSQFLLHTDISISLHLIMISFLLSTYSSAS